MAISLPSLLVLRKDARLQQAPPYISALLICIGVLWIFLLPLDQYSRNTYISENALLPAQVHTYFGGSEQQIFDAYRHEIEAGNGQRKNETSAMIEEIFESAGLTSARQKYSFTVAGQKYSGENVYAILEAPRGDATEAIVLMAAWTSVNGLFNSKGVMLVLTLARYFNRWSLWSKDIIFLITPDSRAGPQAWVDAYHDEQITSSIEQLDLRSGALQGAIAVEHTLNHHFEKLHILYDGINGQLCNLDLFNTATLIASGQMGIGVTLQRMFTHQDSYLERLQTMLRGMTSQGIGASSGPHSSFMPYHIDAITLQTVGYGPEDEMALGRMVESMFRSLNNLLEHFHQSFFFYILMQADRFVSIGTYLPSAMLVAANFSIMAIALWMWSGKPATPAIKVASTMSPQGDSDSKAKADTMIEIKGPDGTRAIVPSASLKTRDRELIGPILLIVSAHFLGLVPLYLFTGGLDLVSKSRNTIFSLLALTNLAPLVLTKYLPILRDYLATQSSTSKDQRHQLIQCLSLLVLGMFLATLATLNFSLSLFVGLICSPLSFISIVANGHKGAVIAMIVLLQACSPPAMLGLVSQVSGWSILAILREASFGWVVNRLWTQIVVWCVWWPAWFVGSMLCASALEW